MVVVIEEQNIKALKAHAAFIVLKCCDQKASGLQYNKVSGQKYGYSRELVDVMVKVWRQIDQSIYK
jgi:hypothetical protein